MLAIIALVVSQLSGVDITGLLGGAGGSGRAGGAPSGTETSLQCTAGQANADDACRIQGAAASLDTYWAGALQGYVPPQPTVVFEQATETGCGSATSDAGPFYCPADRTIYLDTAFYARMRAQFGATIGPLAQLYIIGHEWGHHIQNITGTMRGKELRGSGAASDSVRLELQADCYAGAWIGAAATTRDAQGRTFLQPVTQRQLADALDAAAAVGDDHIEKTVRGSVNPEGFTHGTSAQRQRWFEAGRQGGPGSCDTFSVPPSAL